MESDLPVLEKGQTFESVTDQISAAPLSRQLPRYWLLAFGGAFILVMGFLVGVTYLFLRGVGIWGINIPVAWGFAIVNFVWWIGIGHAGTLISAILLLLRQTWRTSINRFAEAMTLFAVAMAGIYPILHLGRPWLFYALLPYPNTLLLWPQFRSPLIWDIFAVLTYLTVSFLFWFVGLVPDLATLRDKTRSKSLKTIFGIFSLGWRNSTRHWHHYLRAYWLMAALATPLVVSVHSIVSLDFSYSQVAGWHTTIFPPYFVAGAVFSGFAMVLTLIIPLRKWFHFESFITKRHLENSAKFMLFTGMIVAYGYLMETFTGWFSGNANEITTIADRYTGFYAPFYLALIFCNIVVPQTLWFKRVRRTEGLLWVVALFVNVGMWLERFIIVVQSLSKTYLPSAWHTYTPTVWDLMTFAGTIGVFLAMIFVFIRVLPSISIFEMRELVSEQQTHPSEG